MNNKHRPSSFFTVGSARFDGKEGFEPSTFWVGFFSTLMEFHHLLVARISNLNKYGRERLLANPGSLENQLAFAPDAPPG